MNDLDKEWVKKNYSLQVDHFAKTMVMDKSSEYKATRLFESMYKTTHYEEMSSFLKQKFGNDLYFSIDYEVNIGNFSNIGKTFPKHVIEDLQQRKKKLIVDMSEEALYVFVDYTYKNLIIDLNIPEEQIIYIAACPDYYDYIKEISLKYNKKPIHCEHYWFFERQTKQFFIQDMIGSSIVPAPKKINYSSPLKASSFKKKFIHLNRNWRSHRFAMIALLYKRNLLKDGHVSFYYPQDGDENVWRKWYNSMLEKFKDATYYKELEEAYDIKNILPLHLDIDNYLVNGAYFSQRKLSSYLRSAYFSLVSETRYENDNPRFLTEKIFKPVVFKQPFIVISLPKTLELFRSLGYKTFDGIIDESYDLEYDENKRLELIINETTRLCNLSPNQLTDFKTRCLEIVEYNYEVAMNKDSIADYWSK
jgi:hypothetical protein